MKRAGLVAAAAALAACGELRGFGGASPPLVTFQIVVSGDLASLRPAGSTGETSLQVALVWGAQWLTEPFCILPPESAAAAAVIAAGCRDPFGFVPARVAASVPVELDVPATLALADLPSADVLVGDVASRAAYGSFVVYDDRDGGGLQLAAPRGPRDGASADDTLDPADVIYGASFLTMTAPDQRAAFVEGTFTPTAFYPRSGCGDPPAGFSVLSAGGFSDADGVASAATGTLPPEDPATCQQATPERAAVRVDLRAPATASEVGCVERSGDGSTRYLEPPRDAPDLSGRVSACAHLASFQAGAEPELVQLVIAGRDTDRCKGLTHYTLRGCFDDVACAKPEWDFTATPPAWWPCAP